MPVQFINELREAITAHNTNIAKAKAKATAATSSKINGDAPIKKTPKTLKRKAEADSDKSSKRAKKAGRVNVLKHNTSIKGVYFRRQSNNEIHHVLDHAVGNLRPLGGLVRVSLCECSEMCLFG